MGRQINTGVLYLINEVELSIYRFLILGAKKKKSSLNWSSWGSTDSLTVGAFNVLVDYRCFNRTSTKGRSGRRIPRPKMEDYWKRESVFAFLDWISTEQREWVNRYLGRLSRLA